MIGNRAADASTARGQLTDLELRHRRRTLVLHLVGKGNKPLTVRAPPRGSLRRTPTLLSLPWPINQAIARRYPATVVGNSWSATC